jgi:hypothetical protein
MTDSDTFIVGDKNQRLESRRQVQRTNASKNEKDTNVIHNSEIEFLKNLVGPSYLAFGIYGFFNGLYKSTKEITFKNRPKKLIASGILNIVGRQISRFANAGGCLCLIYSLVRKTTTFLFDEELEDLSPVQKQFLFGFLAGSIFKCSRGLYPALFAGTLMGLSCSSFVLLYQYNKIAFRLH